MSDFNFKEAFEARFSDEDLRWDVKGVIDSAMKIYTINNDTKLISKVFELIATPMIAEIAEANQLSMTISQKQTIYPDITLTPKGSKNGRIAVDIKSTYRRNGKVAGFTLGSYTAYIRNPTKNIVFPYDEYAEHWILGFIYDRGENADPEVVDWEDFDSIVPAIHNVEVILQEKWRIASDSAGSGNTTNIGSVANIDNLQNGNGTFVQKGLGEAEFLDYWRNFQSNRDASLAKVNRPFSNIEEYLGWRKKT